MLTKAGKTFPVLKVGIASFAEKPNKKTKNENTRPEEETPTVLERIFKKKTINKPYLINFLPKIFEKFKFVKMFS